MGEFLSTPIRDKHSEDGENNVLRYACCGMQGWRKRMEDSHITDLSIGGSNNHVFGVFDGHGGPEVARFCQRYLVSVLTQQAAWTTHKGGGAVTVAEKPGEVSPRSTPVGQALISTFHALDRMIDDPQRRYVLLSVF